VSPTPGGEPLRVLVADDEPLARERLEHLLEEQPEAALVGVAESGDEAVEAIRELNPDVVFLDMQMPGRTGLDVVRAVGADFMPVTVFVTAHDEFAVQAFELAAADYLLKPFSDERFEEAFRRARDRVEMEDISALREQLEAVLEAGGVGAGAEAGTSPYLKRIAVQGRGRMRVVPVDEINHIVASGVYAELHVGRESHLVRTPLSTLEEHLDPERFFRIHRSAIVNLDEVEVLIREGGGSCLVQLKSGVKLPVGRSRREELEARLGRI
jgi:two-component system, LytTR family, response regulator